MSQYFIDKLVYNNDTLDIHDTEAREMINTNTTNIQAVSARVTKNANDIDALENTTNVIREDLDNVEDRVSVTEAEIDGLKIRATNLEGKMVTVENRLDGHDAKISGLESRMDTAENNITALDGRMTTAENDIDAAEHRLDLVEAKNDEQDIAIDDLEANVAKNTADIVDIKDDLTGIHTDINDLDDRITASTYEAGIGIYFGQGAEHTNINVEDEILNQINQNTIDIQNLKTRTVPAGGTKGQVLTKNSSTDYDVVWGDDLHIVVDDTRTIPTIPNFDKRLEGNQAVISNYLPVAVAGNSAVTYIKSRAYTYDQFDREYKPTVDVEIYPRSDDGIESTRGCVKLHGLHYNSGAVGGSERWLLDGITFDLGEFTTGNGTDASVVTFVTSLTDEQKTLLSDVANVLYNPTSNHFFNGSFTHLAYNSPIGNTDRISNVNCEIYKSGNNILIAAEGSFIPGPDPYATGHQLGMILFKIVYNVTTDTVSTFDYRWLG